MSILNFQKPDKIVMQKANDFEGLFEFKPLEPGFGQTVGNSLRRVLLSSLEGKLLNIFPPAANAATDSALCFKTFLLFII